MSRPSRNGAHVDDQAELEDLEHEAETTQDVVVKILRIAPGVQARVIMLSDNHCGAMFHYVGERSSPCPGDKFCDLSHQKHKPQWRGYTPVLSWSPASQDWYPWVLEITPNLELDFRGKLARGQIWMLQRPKGKANTRKPVTGECVKEIDPEALPPAFDVRTPLLHLYGEHGLDLTVENPLPKRLVVSRWVPPNAAATNGRQNAREAANGTTSPKAAPDAAEAAAGRFALPKTKS